MYRKAVLIIFILLTGLSEEGLFAQSPNVPFRVVGYYSLSSALRGKPKEAPFRRITHINLWFFNPDSLGNFTTDLTRIKSFVKTAHKHHVKVLFSIAGGSPHPYYHTLLNDENRTEFIAKLVEEVLKYDVDGIDVDIEGGDIDENYEAFVTELAASLRAHDKLITAAIAVYYKDQLTDSALRQYDFVNIMSYDRTGPWRPYEPGPHSSLEHARADLEYFGTVRGIPKEKMTLGVPFYGYGFGADSSASSMNFREIITAYPGSEFSDEWKMDNGQVIYYNGIPTMKQKTALAKEKASGIMIWHLRGDARRSKSLLRAIYKGRK